MWVRFKKKHDSLSDTNYWPIGGMQSADITFFKKLRTPSWVGTTQSIFLPRNKQSRGVFCCPGCCHLFQQKLNNFLHLNWAHIANKYHVLLTLLKVPILLLAPGSYLIFVPAIWNIWNNYCRVAAHMCVIFVTGRLRLKSHFKVSYCGFINTFFFTLLQW